ncbi:hypothetical protein TSH7_32135 [Azospirillum sp. TSH7]|nr:hypothetical protein TSH7_32135 [Azospirillum sp. TSH7]PWC64250.1 hypothetical protein TSH20_18795 [Azospirillum sp. TSH20]
MGEPAAEQALRRGVGRRRRRLRLRHRGGHRRVGRKRRHRQGRGRQRARRGRAGAAFGLLGRGVEMQGQLAVGFRRIGQAGDRPAFGAGKHILLTLIGAFDMRHDRYPVSTAPILPFPPLRVKAALHHEGLIRSPHRSAGVLPPERRPYGRSRAATSR